LALVLLESLHYFKLSFILLPF